MDITPEQLIAQLAITLHETKQEGVLGTVLELSGLEWVERDKAIDLLERVSLGCVMIKALRIKLDRLQTTDGKIIKTEAACKYLDSVILLMEQGTDGWDKLGEQLRTEKENEQ